METKDKIKNGGLFSLKTLRIISIICLVFTACFVGVASAEEWTGWTYKDSQFEQFSNEWVQDVQQHAAVYIYDSSKDFDWRAQAQAYVLGWDDRITYVDEHGTIDEGHVDEETGEWIEGTGDITYDWGFWGNLFGWGVPENLFQNISEYEMALNIYSENYNAVIQPVPREV